MPWFRLIDTKNQCVFRATDLQSLDKLEYATLSYVWGNSKDDLKATKETMADLEKPGLLSKCYPPSTVIGDAIKVCRELKIDYLWVDRLCIRQDGTDADAHFAAMSEIYSCSYLTIVALAGEDVHYGLPGISPNRRRVKLPNTLDIPGLFFIHMQDNYQDLANKSYWSSRGWTFQEALLSPKLLLFSESGVFIECCHTNEVQDEDDGMRIHKGFTEDNNYSLSTAFPQLLNAYTKRQLSFDDDILNAFLGVLVSKYGNDHYLGVPFREFDKTILWKTRDGEYPPRVSVNGIFPSWSCSSVKGEIDLLPQSGPLLSLAMWGIPSDDPQRPFHLVDTPSLQC
ncbi:HET-domain-containing protein [Aspergillus sclerotiicarbonarius CBS 121057]|uniref:HET-domain-containing protein n=1 Tax=Aspergillus sclerotiicarbonarius (strain CBS 121057 / IBT 28362) TaxID=1448318 RepID=A0A319ES81_ASPSB|nr:HET-domain-containing protein [Aspergillus sclerotiicarbonarius CBS 121057]